MVLLSTRYKELVYKGEMSFDPAQLALTKHFDHLLQDIAERNVSHPWAFLHFFKKKNKPLFMLQDKVKLPFRGCIFMVK